MKCIIIFWKTLPEGRDSAWTYACLVPIWTCKGFSNRTTVRLPATVLQSAFSLNVSTEETNWFFPSEFRALWSICRLFNLPSLNNMKSKTVAFARSAVCAFYPESPAGSMATSYSCMISPSFSTDCQGLRHCTFCHISTLQGDVYL